MDDIRVYRGRILYLLPLIIFLVGIILAILIESDFNDPNVLIVDLFLLLFCIIPILSSVGFKLEVGPDYVRESFFGFQTMKVIYKDIEGVRYGRIGLWGSLFGRKGVTTYGNGIVFLIRVEGNAKDYGLSEKLYGKEAVDILKNRIGPIFK